MRFDFLKYTLIVFISMLFCACNYFLGSEPKQQILAKVDDRVLYISELERDMPKYLLAADSVSFAEEYINKWINKQLKVLEAEKFLGDKLVDINRMVDDYRTTLLNFKIEQSWVEQKIDSLASGEQIEKYYNDHMSEFAISRPLVKGTIVKLPESYRQKMELFRLMGSQSESSKQDFIDICVKNNFELYEFSSWTELPDFISVLPTVKGRNYEYLLKKVRSVQEMADVSNKYFIYISNFLTYGNYAPLENVNTTISRILYNKQKQDIINQKQEQLYLQALEQERIVLPLKK